jgi:hypothetical protein
MNRDEFLLALRIADDIVEGEPFSPWSQRIADHDADQRVLITLQQHEIDRLRAQHANSRRRSHD